MHRLKLGEVKMDKFRISSGAAVLVIFSIAPKQKQPGRCWIIFTLPMELPLVPTNLSFILEVSVKMLLAVFHVLSFTPSIVAIFEIMVGNFSIHAELTGL